MSINTRIKKAVILAAGRGARLDRLNSPKPLVKVGGKPLILWIIKNLEAIGIEDIIITIGDRNREVKSILTGNEDIKANIVFIDVDVGSINTLARSVAALEQYIDEPFYLAASDLVFERNPFECFSGISSQVLVDKNDTRADQSGARSRVRVDVSGRIVQAGHDLNKGFMQTGVYVLSPEFLSWLNSEGSCIESMDNALVAYSKLHSIETIYLGDGEWYDVNTPAIHVRAELLARSLMNQTQFDSLDASSFHSLDIAYTFSRTRIMQTNIIVEQGILNSLGQRQIISKSHRNSNHYILTDSNVDELYGEAALLGLSKAGYKVQKLVVVPGETSKNIHLYSQIADEIFSRGLDKYSIIISLGGGVLNNIAGFLASTLYRGIGLIHIPTTSMAQVDAAIDFKQAVNASFGKNLFGSYYPAQTIIIDPCALLSLPKRNLYDGFAESIKHALVQDSEFLAFLYANAKNIDNVDVLEEIIRRTLALKVPLLNGDIKDDYNEMLPQYGHSVGHAVEHLSGYELFHGEAVAVGMCVVAEIARLMGICSDDVVEKHYKICEQYYLPTRVPKAILPEDVVNTIRYDKHFLLERAHMALPVKLGACLEEKGVYGLPVDLEFVRQAVFINQSRK